MSKYPINKDTQNHVAICLSRLFDDMVFDRYRSNYEDAVTKWFTEEQKIATKESMIRRCACASTLLLGPFDIGLKMVTNHSLLGIMLALAQSDDEVCQVRENF